MVREKKGVDFEGQVRERERDFQALAHRLTKDVLTKPFVTHTRAHMCVCVVWLCSWMEHSVACASNRRLVGEALCRTSLTATCRSETLK